MRKNRIASSSSFIDRFLDRVMGPSEEEGRALAELEERVMLKSIALREERDRLHALAERALEQLLWCSGSADFQSDGMAREGWEHGVVPVIDALRAELSPEEPSR